MSTVESWRQLLSRLRNSDINTKLNEVNVFFNDNIEYSTDSILWNSKDYWATPVETLLKGAGDCDDFSIAKYYSLTRVGVDARRLFMLYSKHIPTNQPHMLLMYDDVIMDNINKNILKLSDRSDLLPIYSFNEFGMLLEKDNKKIPIPKVELRLWNEVLLKLKDVDKQLSIE